MFNNKMIFLESPSEKINPRDNLQDLSPSSLSIFPSKYLQTHISLTLCQSLV